MWTVPSFRGCCQNIQFAHRAKYIISGRKISKKDGFGRLTLYYKALWQPFITSNPGTLVNAGASAWSRVGYESNPHYIKSIFALATCYVGRYIKSEMNTLRPGYISSDCKKDYRLLYIFGPNMQPMRITKSHTHTHIAPPSILICSAASTEGAALNK